MHEKSNDQIGKVDILLKQYEEAWKQILYLDSSYTQTSLIYIALIGAYIGVFDRLLEIRS